MNIILDQSMTTTDGDNYFGRSDRLYASQSFTPTKSGKCTQVDIALKKVLSPTGTVTVYIYSDNAGVPGSALGTMGTLDPSTLTTSYVFKSFVPVVDLAPPIVAGTKYHIVAVRSPSDDTNYVQWGGKSANTYAGGNDCYSANGTVWTSEATIDNEFKQYYSPTTGGFFMFM